MSSASSRLTVKSLKVLAPERTVEPHISQFFLNTVGAETLVEVFEIDKIEVLVLVEA